MKTLALCGSILAVCVASASAADIAVKAPRISAPAENAASWTGFYLGASLGGKQANADWTTVSLQNPFAPPGALVIDASSPARYQPSSGRFGGFLGYDLQFSPRWVGGIELDAAWSDRTAAIAGIPGCTITCIGGVPGPSGDTSSVRMKWDASARARVGYLVLPNLLVYGTGGIAWQSVEGSAACKNNVADAVCFNLANNSIFTATNSTIRTGWTVGGGIDARIFGNWMLRGEYRYSDFGTWNNSYALGAGGPASATTVGTRLKITTQIGLVGIAYKFGGPLVARY